MAVVNFPGSCKLAVEEILKEAVEKEGASNAAGILALITVLKQNDKSDSEILNVVIETCANLIKKNIDVTQSFIDHIFEKISGKAEKEIIEKYLKLKKAENE